MRMKNKTILPHNAKKPEGRNFFFFFEKMSGKNCIKTLSYINDNLLWMELNNLLISSEINYSASHAFVLVYANKPTC